MRYSDFYMVEDEDGQIGIVQGHKNDEDGVHYFVNFGNSKSWYKENELRPYYKESANIEEDELKLEDGKEYTLVNGQNAVYNEYNRTLLLDNGVTIPKELFDSDGCCEVNEDYDIDFEANKGLKEIVLKDETGKYYIKLTSCGVFSGIVGNLPDEFQTILINIGGEIDD